MTDQPDSASPAEVPDRATIPLSGEQAELLQDALDELTYDLSHYAIPPSKFAKVTQLRHDRIDHQAVGLLEQLLAVLDAPSPSEAPVPIASGDLALVDATPGPGGDNTPGIRLTVDVSEMALLKEAVRERIFDLTHQGDPTRVNVPPGEYPYATLDRLSILFDRLAALRWPAGARQSPGWFHRWSRWFRPDRREPDAR